MEYMEANFQVRSPKPKYGRNKIINISSCNCTQIISIPTTTLYQSDLFP